MIVFVACPRCEQLVKDPNADPFDMWHCELCGGKGRFQKVRGERPVPNTNDTYVLYENEILVTIPVPEIAVAVWRLSGDVKLAHRVWWDLLGFDGEEEVRKGNGPGGPPRGEPQGLGRQLIDLQEEPCADVG